MNDLFSGLVSTASSRAIRAMPYLGFDLDYFSIGAPPYIGTSYRAIVVYRIFKLRRYSRNRLTQVRSLRI